jgi:hypothetical protein
MIHQSSYHPTARSHNADSVVKHCISRNRSEEQLIVLGRRWSERHYEDYYVLGYDTVQSGRISSRFQGYLLPPYSGSKFSSCSLHIARCLVYYLALKMEALIRIVNEILPVYTASYPRKNSSQLNILSRVWMTTDRFCTDDRIYWTLSYSAWLHFTICCNTHT